MDKKKVFTRLTSNDNNWEVPSPHGWKKSNQGNNKIAYENQYGFGHEEWLFHPRFNIGGYQYGYIRGLEKVGVNENNYDEVHLYTVRKENRKNNVYYLGYIENVRIIKNDPVERNLFSSIASKYDNEIISEIKDVNGDITGFTENPIKAIVKFKLSDVRFLDQPIYQPNFDLKKHPRFQPYELNGGVELFFHVDPDISNTIFTSGRASQLSVYNRSGNSISKTIVKLHSEIIEALEDYLKPNFSVEKYNLAIEIMRFHGNIADMVTLDSMNQISIYEVKTSSSGRRNIREAISQLLDYASHAGKYSILKLVIVSPVTLNKSEQMFLESLRNVIKYEISYLAYNASSTIKFE